MMDGRVKTLHPMVHGGLLAVRDDAEHVKGDDGAWPSARSTSSWSTSIRSRRPWRRARTRDEIIENIDIGGPSMVRSAAKNHESVTIVTDPADYARSRRAGRQWRRDDLDFRKRSAPPRPMPPPPPMTG
ncbi:MAG: hypothetical protein LKM31_06910 [Sphingobium sp.]|jgi:phosphoribosylaminoimidazolecarboxamide formyltransferase/IMP cyclohydrolase|nr:hypothetical protein [Sphingobium sp.]